MMETAASASAPQDPVANGVPAGSSLVAIDPEKVVQHLAAIVTIALGASNDDLRRDGNLLSPSSYADTVQRCTRFATDSQVALYIQKEMLPSPEAAGDSVDAAPTVYLYTLTGEISASPTIAAYLLLLKRPQAIDPSLPLTSQIQIQTLPGAASLSNVVADQGPSASPIEFLHTIVHNVVAPYFDANTKTPQSVNGARSRADVDAKTGIPVTKKRMAEFELSLLHLQQNVEIPELLLPFHPVVQSALDTATAQGIKPTTDLIPAALMSDSTFMNNLQSTVNNWIKAIQGITKLTRDPVTRTATQEINFWLSMESALERIEVQLRSEGVMLTLEILKHAKRFQATVSFSSDTGLKEAMETVQKYNQLMRDFPLDELLSATSLPKVNDAIVQIFNHMNKKMRFSNYPIKRTLDLVEAISADLKEVMHRLLPGTDLVNLEYDDFRALMATADQIFQGWDAQIKEFTNIARETTRRRQEKFIPIKINPRHSDLQARLKYIATFRENHEQLQRTIVIVLGPKASVSGAEPVANGTPLGEELGEVDAVQEVKQAWDSLKNVDLLDVSEEGTQRWARAENTYNERTTRVENSIIARLRDRLATAKNANEMFRVFSQFNALFVRPKIRGAIAEYQNQLIDNVKQAISALHERFKQQYGHSEAHAMAQLHDLPPVSGAIIWARQIERQLDGYMRKVEDILGSDWIHHTEGQKLQTESDLFRKKLNTQTIYKAWIEDVQRKNISISGRLFNVNKIRSANNALDLSVNFDAQIITLFKETRNLGWQNFNVPHSVSNTAKDAKRVYPFAVSLMESVRTFTQTSRQISEMSDVSIMLSGYQHEVHGLIERGVPLKWSSFLDAWDVHMRPHMPNGTFEQSLGRGGAGTKHVQFVRDFASAASLLQSKTIALSIIHATIQKALKELGSCPYEASEFETRLQTIQAAVDQLNLEQYVNLGYWVEQMNDRIKATLLTRLQHAIISWIQAFEDESLNTDEDTHRKALVPSGETAKSDAPPMKELVHEITMRNQVIYLDPPLEFARASWYMQLHDWLGVVCNLPKIKASRYQMSLTLSTAAIEEARFTDLPADCTEILSSVYVAVEKKLSSIGAYVEKWLQFQSLWDLQSEQVYELLGEELSKWLQLLQEIRKSRATFDTTEVSRSFGRITIDYEQVQTKVNAKYDQWQHDILMKFGGRLGGRMREVHSEIEKARRDLEGQSLEATSTAQAVQFITIVQASNRNLKIWGPQVEVFRQGQQMLYRNRYQFPNDWLDIQQVESMWESFSDLLSRKGKIVEDQTDALKAKITAEDQVVSGKISEVAIQWNEEKPVSGTIAPEIASKTLAAFEARVTKLQEEFEMVSKAKQALDLPASPESSLSVILEEVQDFKSVWAALSTIWKSLNELGETPWASVQPRKIRSSIDGLIKMTKEMPSRMRQYAAFEHVQTVLRQYLKANAIMSDLKSDAIKERHWEKIWKELKPGRRYSQVSTTLGDVWDLNLVACEVVIRDIVTQAQGEMALEEFLKQIKDIWENYSLDLTNYQNKCRLIRKECYDDMNAKSGEHLNSLQAMKHSPYYKTFEQDASNWETRMNEIGVLLDVFQKVQQKWVYLEGVFTGNADIKHLLPHESNKFQRNNDQFRSVMTKVSKRPMILEVLRISNLANDLDNVLTAFNSVSSGLDEYLERERASFPRFYFVGNDDLLEMIGNSNDTMRITKHFKKMFAGLNSLIMDEDGVISGFTSKEGEEVVLKKEISVIKTPRINDWLALLESGMKNTLAELLAEAVEAYSQIFNSDSIDQAALNGYIGAYPSQVMVLATQAVWTSAVDKSLEEGGQTLQSLYDREVQLLSLLAETVLGDLGVIQRKKCEALITNYVHQRDIIGKLMKFNVTSANHYLWLIQMRYSYVPEGDLLQRLNIKMANAKLNYGYEYLGIPDRLVRTPLTDRCFLTLTQALCQRLGGSPYGPAGTGKTESVKALGVELGRFTLVFCCDDTFDDGAMGRIFLGICQVGAWGCFDEFNRLEERILSAVSQQIQDIQLGLKHQSKITLKKDSSILVNTNTGIFITMNPGYAGRSNLPDNLKKLFRSVAMSKPDKELIAEVMLYSQGFKQAKQLSTQVVPFFDQCSSRLSKQAHYDFGLRALKSVLVSSGGLKRARLASGNMGAEEIVEPEIIVQSVRETIAPKLVHSDVEIMVSVEKDTFPGVQYVPGDLAQLEEAIRTIAKERSLVVTDTWMTKILQLYQIQNIHHGVMMVGGSGAGKSAAWRLLIEALKRVENVQGVSHIIDSKVMSKEALYGTLDPTTREWTDGLFTSILRTIIDNLRGEDQKRHWIIFDGDVDPEWVENLNSVLDDNKLLTLPNGERLNLPSNVRVMFEVETLKYATLATVSRCGMVWFSEDVVNPGMMVTHYLEGLRKDSFEDLDEDIVIDYTPAQALELQKQAADLLEGFLEKDSFIHTVLDEARGYNHIMEFTVTRVLTTLFSLLNKSIRNLIEYNAQHVDFPLDSQQIQDYMSKKLLLALVWSLTGDCPLLDRKAFGDKISTLASFTSPPIDGASSLIDFDVSLPRAEWSPWQNEVPTIEVNTHSITQTDVVIPTLDTVRHEDVLYSWLAEHKPLLLCGPPGSGKTMTLFSALRKLPKMEVVGLNFSSATTPDLLIKTFEQYCEYRKTLHGVVLSPTQTGKWLVVFCDEINLPAPDKYGTQRAISFLRQLVEHNGFWRTKEKQWVTLDRIQFVGACNPPTDAGRTPLTLRFLRHAPLIMVDYPGEISLNQIYGTFNSAVLKIVPSLRGHSDQLTQAMVRFYLESQQRFTAKIQPHYVYSPRELTRWVRGVYEAIKPLESLSVEGLVRIWAHEALRLFQDRLVTEEERQWTDQVVRRIAMEFFPNIDEEKALGGPILFSNWLSKNYVPVDREQLREFVKARLKTFCEEEVDVPLILFNEVLEHVLRIDRVFRQPQGHLILIGVSGSGKTTLSRFVAWMNGLKVFQIKVHGKYSAADFDDDLRDVLRRCGCRGEKICFIMDEANVLDSGFLERMNTLLANAEVPGLFEGDEFATLMTACREGAQREGLVLDSQEELYKWFTGQIVKNLHVVFTMNPPEEGLSSKAATSPALFNRCVLNWMGDWSDQAFFQVASELTTSVDLDKPNFTAPDTIPIAYRNLSNPASHRETIANSMVYIHYSIQRFNDKLRAQQGKVTFLTPRHYLDFVAQFVKLYDEKRGELEEQQRHLNVGLDKLRDTFQQVNELQSSLEKTETQLEQKEKEANEKLQQMVVSQTETKLQQEASIELDEALEKQKVMIQERKVLVEEELAEVLPAVQAAMAAVGNIKKQHLQEVRAMNNPPVNVKNTMAAVVTMLHHADKADTWTNTKTIIRQEDFIRQITEYDTKTMLTKSIRKMVQERYLSDPKFTFENVNKASKACGPLVSWLQAQIKYSDMEDQVEPKNREITELNDAKEQTEAESAAVKLKLQELQNESDRYKAEFEALTVENQKTRDRLQQVRDKVTRSSQLLASLSSERSRWEDSSKSFETQIATLVGDVLVAAAFLAYSGLYDQTFRKSMTNDWLHQLTLSGVQFKQPNPITEYLSTADERLGWQANGLPVDDLCTENAIILKRFNRYPLIIDPSGRVTDFLLNESKDRRLTVTSFLDGNFTKQLESAIRFGNPILIQDAEYLDPVLNHVLNKEYQRTGGRVLIQLGKQQVDFSPSFKLYLSTRDPSATFPPDICSRTTFVNFTVTQSSLQTQSLNDVLKSERPDVDEKRSNLIKSQGEFKVTLRRLENELLQALNESRGNILDDDNVIATLERLKKEAAEISDKMSNTEGAMAEVEKTTNEYLVVARSCSAIFAVLDTLNTLSRFYQFSLQYFLDIFHSVLHGNMSLANEPRENYDIRRKIIVRDLFVTTFRRTALGLLQQDFASFALLLVQASPTKMYAMDKSLLDAVLDTSVEGQDLSTNPDARNEAFAAAKNLAALREKLDQVPSDAWDKFLTEEQAEKCVPQIDAAAAPFDQGLLSLLLIKMFRLDRFLPAAEQFVTSVFGEGFFDTTEDLKQTVDQVSSSTPISLVSSPGFDASYKVDNLVERLRVTCTNIAMGSKESQAVASRAVGDAASNGNWVLVKNVHLTPEWLQSLEKTMESLRPRQGFRLFLSMETSGKIPVNFLRASRILMNEQPAGVRANMKDTMTSLSDRAVKPPVERSRVYLLLAFLHAVVQERLRYAPKLGWKGFWEFNDADYECSAFIIDTWIEWAAQTRTNIAPQNIPWDMICYMVREAYGGKIDDEGDFNVLTELVNRILQPAAFDIGHKLVEGTETENGLEVPSGTSHEQFMDWIRKLPEREPPTYLGLPANAEKLLLVAQGRDIISKTREVGRMLDEGEQLMDE